MTLGNDFIAGQAPALCFQDLVAALVGRLKHQGWHPVAGTMTARRIEQHCAVGWGEAGEHQTAAHIANPNRPALHRQPSCIRAGGERYITPQLIEAIV